MEFVKIFNSWNLGSVLESMIEEINEYWDEMKIRRQHLLTQRTRMNDKHG